jgi:hypothetical protein
MPEEIQKIILGANCRLVTLKRFIVAETILMLSALTSVLYMTNSAMPDGARDIALGWLALGGLVSAYYFKSLADENKMDQTLNQGV